MNTSSDRRGELVCMVGGVFSVAAFLLLLLFGASAHSLSATAASWFALGTLALWIVSWARLHQQRLLEEEQLELEQLERERQEKLGGGKSIFDEQDLEQMDAMSMGRRLRSIEGGLVPVIALLMAAFFVVVGLQLFPWQGDSWWQPSATDMVIQTIKDQNSGFKDYLNAVDAWYVVIAFMSAGISIASFFLSRAAGGLAKLPRFQLLSAAANGAFGVTISAGLVAIVYVVFAATKTTYYLDNWASYAIATLMLLLALETSLNFIFDFYRPRVAGVTQRAFYDSRVLGMFSETSGMLQSAAAALDYQFGFKVSDTWFFQLFSRWVLPLLLIQAFVLWLLTSPVVVPEGYEAVIEHFRPVGGQMEPTVVGAGLHITWPWPFDRSYEIPTAEIRHMEIGYEAGRELKARTGEPELWTQKHRGREYALIVPDRKAAADESLPLNLLSVTIPIQWRVKPGSTLQFHRQSVDVPAIIEASAYRVLTRFAGQADIADLLSVAGAEASAIIHADLQRELDRSGLDGEDLGVLITHVSLANVHPITQAAEAYEQTVDSYQRKQAYIRMGMGQADGIRAEAGGLRTAELYELILAEDAAERELREVTEAGGDVETARAARDAASKTVAVALVEFGGGNASQIVSLAALTAYSRVMTEAADAELYRSQLETYRQAPQIYMLRRYLSTVQVALQGVRKFIITLDDPSRVIMTWNHESAVSKDLIGGVLKSLREN